MTEPVVLTPDEVQSLLRSGSAATIVGARETEEVDFKAEPYRLQDEQQKFELAKDLSAFANAKGGVLALGIKTKKSEAHPWDVAAGIVPFPSDMMDESRVRKILADWLYPPLDDVVVELYPVESGATFALLRVPQQPPSVGPYIVTKAIDDRGRVSGAQLAFYKRSSDRSRPLSAPEIQNILRDGIMFRRFLDDRGLVSVAPPSPPPAVRVEAPPEARVPDVTFSRLGRLIDAVELSNSPTFALTATPHPLVDGTGLLAADTDPLSRAFLQPPELRGSGFDLDAIGTPTIYEGRARRSLMTGYKARELWTDGVLLFVATGGEDFLSWGDRSSEQPLQVNSLPLIESTLLFCKLAQTLFSATPAAPSHVIYSVHLLRLCVDSKPPRLNRRHISSPKLPEVSGCDFEDVVVKSFSSEAAVTAFELVRNVHAWFHLTYDRVPFARDGRVDEQQLISLR